jgi:hypothetical protein
MHMTLSSLLTRVSGGERRQGNNDEHRRGAKERTTPHTLDRGVELEREAVQQLDPRVCRRYGSEETMISAVEWPRGSGANPKPKMRVLDWILSGPDEGPSVGSSVPARRQ